MQEKLTLIRRELQEIVVLTSKLTTQLGGILTSKNDHLINSFGITLCDNKLHQTRPSITCLETPDIHLNQLTIIRLVLNYGLKII